MHLWVAVGIFLLGAGTGALTTFALYVKHIRYLNDLLKTERNSPTKEEERPELKGRKSA